MSLPSWMPTHIIMSDKPLSKSEWQTMEKIFKALEIACETLEILQNVPTLDMDFKAKDDAAGDALKRIEELK